MRAARLYHGALHMLRLALYRAWRGHGTPHRVAYAYACAYRRPPR